MQDERAMELESELEPRTNGAAEPKRPRRKRVGRKRTVFHKTPRPAWPVRGLWDAAPEEEKRRAHVTCMAILEYWLGKKEKGEVAKALEVTPLRVWQLSQKALSGMMAGLLVQPRRRVEPEVFEGPVEETRPALKARILELEKKLSRTEDLVRVLRTAPWTSAATDSTPKGASRGAKTKRKRSPKRGANSKATRRPRDPQAGRATAASEAPLADGAG